MISESMMTMIIIMLANGWMTRNLAKDSGMYLGSGPLGFIPGGGEFFMMLGTIVTMHHLLIGCFTYIDRDA